MTIVRAPFGGVASPLAECPDAVFSTLMLGNGVILDADSARSAVGGGEPEPGADSDDAPIRDDDGFWPVFSPVGGTVVKAKLHAMMIAADGLVLLIHLGLDTYSTSEAFRLDVADGDEVFVGQKLGGWKPELIVEAGLNPLAIIAAMERPEVAKIANGQVGVGDRLFEVE